MKRVSRIIDVAHALMERGRQGNSNVFVINPTEQVFTYIDPNGEMWHFDIAEGYRLARERYAELGIPSTPLYVSDFGDAATVRARHRDLDEERVRNAETTEPILAVAWQENGESGVLLIDGTHRVIRAIETGQKFIPGYILDRREDVEAIILCVADRELTARLVEEGL